RLSLRCSSCSPAQLLGLARRENSKASVVWAHSSVRFSHATHMLDRYRSTCCAFATRDGGSIFKDFRSIHRPAPGWYIAYSPTTSANVVQTVWFVKDPHRFTSCDSLIASSVAHPVEENT